MNSHRWFLLLFAAAGIVVFLLALRAAIPPEAVRWTAIHVSGDNQSGDAHLLRFPSGKIILLDTGFGHYAQSHLIPALEARGVLKIDTVLISHAHRNHYGALAALLERFPVGEVYFNLPPRRACDKENWALSCDSEHIKQTSELIQQKSELKSVQGGDLIHEEPGASLRAAYYFDNQWPIFQHIGVNDTSVVYRLEYGERKVLFPGDIGQQVGDFLVKAPTGELLADAMTAPHHGVRTTVPMSFYDAVRPKLVVVSVAGALWKGDRAKQTREHLAKAGVPVYVTGELGNIDIVIQRDAISVR